MWMVILTFHLVVSCRTMVIFKVVLWLVLCNLVAIKQSRNASLCCCRLLASLSFFFTELSPNLITDGRETFYPFSVLKHPLNLSSQWQVINYLKTWLSNITCSGEYICSAGRTHLSYDMKYLWRPGTSMAISNRPTRPLGNTEEGQDLVEL